MKALILAAHGSRKKESAMEVAALTKKIAQKAEGKVDAVAHAFLQFCEPYLEDVIAEMADKGAEEILIFPFFISAGSHVRSDIPELVDQARAEYPGVRFAVTRHLGILPAVEDIILTEISDPDGNIHA